MTPEEIAETLEEVYEGDELRVTDDKGITVDVGVIKISSKTDASKSVEDIYYEVGVGIDIEDSPTDDSGGEIYVRGEGWDWESATITYYDHSEDITRDIEELEVVE